MWSKCNGMSPQKRCSPRKKATPQKRSSPTKPLQSPAFKGKRELIRRKIRQPSRRSLAFGSPSVGSPMVASEIFTESMPAPFGTGSSSSALFPLDIDEPTPSPTIINPFKKGSPLKKRRRTDARPLNAFGSQIDNRPQAPVDWDDETANDSFSTPPTATNQRKSSLFTRTKSQMDTSALMADYALDFSVLDTSIGSKNGSPLVKIPEEKCSHRLPLDNRLGTKLRITSPIPFPWMTDTATGQYLVRITGKDAPQHLGTKLFIQNGLDDIAKPCLSTSGASKAEVLLTAASSYWQHPVLAWLPLFPRLSTQSKLIKEKVAPPLAPAMLDAINTEWCGSLESLFLSWKKGDRHSFYVCCPNVTAHFTRIHEEKRQGTGDESISCFATSEGLKHAVFLTPTTSGFRSFLRTEGIQVETLDERGKRRLSRTGSFRAGDGEESRCSLGGESSRLSIGSVNTENGAASAVSFQMGGEEDSLMGKENSKSGDGASRLDVEECTKEGEKSPEKHPSEEESESGDETSPTKMGDAHDWLKGIGVSPASTLRMRRHHTALGRLTGSGGGGSKGGTPIGPARRFQRENSDGVCTVVVRESSSVQALYNLLLQSKSVRAIAGPHASLPPTLLAAQPFQGAQLQTLKKTSQILKRAGRGVEHVLELEGGPIMPHSAQLAVEFARSMLRDSDTSNVPGATVHIRVNDRNSCSGLNSLLEEESGCDWTEMNVTMEGECKWRVEANR